MIVEKGRRFGLPNNVQGSQANVVRVRFVLHTLLMRLLRASSFARVRAIHSFRQFRTQGLGAIAVAVAMIASAEISAASCAGQCPTRADLTERAQPAIELPSELRIRLPEQPTVISVHVDADGDPVFAVMLISSGMAILDSQAKMAAMRSKYTSMPKRCGSALRTYRFIQRWDIFNNS